MFMYFGISTFVPSNLVLSIILPVSIYIVYMCWVLSLFSNVHKIRLQPYYMYLINANLSMLYYTCIIK